MKSYFTEILAPSPKSFWKFCLVWLLLFGLSVLVRLPHFLSKNFWFDGDEAMVGIMAQDFLEGKSFPFYFYGQNYGLSTLEAISTALFIALLGSGIWALRLGGLLLFSLGVTFLVRAIQRQHIPRWVWFSLTALLITFPTWYLWGAMVRGGYVTSFLFVCVVFYWMLETHFSYKQLIWIGVSAAIAFEAHLLILLPVIPMIAAWVFKHPNGFRNACLLLGIFVVSVLTIRGIGYLDVAYWKSPPINWGIDKQLANLEIQGHGLVAGYSNFFFFGMNIERPSWWDLLLKISLILSLLLLVWDFFQASKYKKYFYGFALLMILVYVFLMSTIRIPSPRYWMGLFSGILFWLILIFISRENKRFVSFSLLVLTLISVLGITTGSKMKQDWYDAGVNELQAFEGFHKEVQKHHPKAIYITDNLIQWQWNYLYGKEIPASAFRSRERTQFFCDQVERNYQKNPEKVVIGGLWGIALQMDTIRGFNDYRYQVETKYFINPYARKDFVDQGIRTMKGE